MGQLLRPKGLLGVTKFLFVLGDEIEFQRRGLYRLGDVPAG